MAAVNSSRERELGLGVEGSRYRQGRWGSGLGSMPCASVDTVPYGRGRKVGHWWDARPGWV